MSLTIQSEYRTGTCKRCGDHGNVFRYNGLCEDCDSNTISCRICREWQHRVDKCRHVFQDQEYQWRGAGVAPCDDEMKVPFHRLLSAMGEDFARDLKTAIRSGRFYTWFVAPMIGGGGSLQLNGMPDRDGKWTNFEWGDRLIELGESDRAEEYEDGYHWLVSLYETKTTKANRTTVAWIDRWLWPLTPERLL